jgi:very-short-patch-repair endonuclease
MARDNNLLTPYFNAAPVTHCKAKVLRKKMTPAEKKLWQCLRNRQFRGLKFRRQHPIDKYIVDFICVEQKLVVEVDGGIHLLAEQKEHDAYRTEELTQNYGLRIIRLTNEEVENDIWKALKKIEGFLSSFTSPCPGKP